MRRSRTPQHYRTGVLGPSGQNDLAHYETRLRDALDEDGRSIAMEILAEAATQGAFTVGTRGRLGEIYSRMMGDAHGRIDEVLDVLEHDGYLAMHDDDYRFQLHPLRDWWATRFRNHHVPISDRVRRAAEGPTQMSELQARIIRKRNPGMLQSDQEVKEQFVVREHELATVLEILRGNVDTNSCQHTLIVAPRGRGKTMLLARVAAELRVDAELASRLLPVPFMEESDEILTAADFWLEVLFYLALAVDKQDPETARNLRATRADLTSRWRERELDERARVAVLEAAEALGRRLVLMVENLQALCANVDDDFGWKLRKTLQTEPQIVLVATATSRFEALNDAREPFFELFRIISLAPLDAAQCGLLWKLVSGDTASERQQRALEILTGGSPRYLVIVAEFARHRSVRQLMEELVQLIDDLTDTFRSYQKALPKTERRVFLAIADLWQASSTGEIAARARMDVRTVSTMLGRLVKRQAVNGDGHGRKRLYRIAEPLYCIYYQLRRERDEAAIVQNLLRFMTVFYPETKISKLFESLQIEALESPAELTDKVALNAQALIASAAEGIERGEYGAAIEKCDQVISRLATSDTVELQALALHAYTRKGLAQGRAGNSQLELETNREALARFGASDEPALQYQIAVALFNTGTGQIRMGDISDAIATCDQFVKRFENSDENRILVLTAKCLINEGSLRGQLGDHDSEMAAYLKLINQFAASDLAELQVQVVTALFNAGLALARRGSHHEAIAICDQVVARYGTSEVPEIQSRVARTLINKGVEQLELGWFAAAITTFDNVEHRFRESNETELRAWAAQSLAYKAVVQDRMGDPEAGVRTSDEVVERYGACKEATVQLHVAGALLQKGSSLGEVGRHHEAIAASDAVRAFVGESDDPELQALVARAMNNKGVSQALLHDASGSIATNDAVVGRFGSSDVPELQAQTVTALFHKGMTQVRDGRADEALLTANQVASRSDWKACYVQMAARLSQGSRTAAVDAFCSLYAAFAPENEAMAPELVEAAAMLVAGGVPAREIIGVLQSDLLKAARVAPLSIALRQRNGEKVRAPAEMLEVAADVGKRIDQTEPLPASTRTEMLSVQAC